jgi:hypothetical protein
MNSPSPTLPPPEGGQPERQKGTREGRRRQAVQGLPQQRRLSTRAAVIAVAAHVVILVALVQILTFGHGIPSWLRFQDKKETREERLTFVRPEAPKPQVAELPTPRVQRPAPTTPTLQQPSAPTNEAPAAPATAPIAPRDTGSGGTAGNGIGALDPNVRGVRPGYTDERVWRGPVGNGGGGGGGAARGDRADNLDSIMANAIMGVRDSLDSLARAQGKYGRAPGDWTKTGKNGEKWGWDQQGIRLGKFMIPNALLGLLPMNAATAAGLSGNPIAMDAARRTAAFSADIQRMSARGMGDAEFRKIVKEMDARRDTQRRDRLRAPSASYAAPVKTDGKSTSPNGQPNGR